MEREEIVKRLRIHRSFIVNKYLNRENIYKYLYNIKDPELEIAKYFQTSYNVVSGSVIGNIKFDHKNGQRDYLIFSANSGYAYPQQIVVGGEVNGKVYLIREDSPLFAGEISTLVCPDSSYFDHKVVGFLPKMDRHSILLPRVETDLSDEDIECINYARKSASRISRTLKKAIVK